MSENAINQESMLRVGTILHGSYRIDRYLSSGGFGNTYVATHIDFDETYAVKEFFMKGVTQRDGNNTTVSVSNREKVDEFKGQLEKFKKEARRLRRLNNPHIVRVHDLFEENGTAYYVMDYVDGENLKERMVRTKQPLTESEVNAIIPQVLDALSEVHANNIWHLDLKPANIMVDSQGSVKLIDFGASKQFNAQKGGATTGTAISYTPGYAPREQMEQSYEKFGPWTDFYALGGTLYNLLTNMRPPMPTDIDDDHSEDKHLALPLPPNISGKTKALILWLMKTNKNERPGSVQNIYEFLEEEPVPEPVPIQGSAPNNVESEVTVIEERHEEEPDKEHIVGKEPSRHDGGQLKTIAVSAVIVMALVLGGYYLWNGMSQRDTTIGEQLQEKKVVTVNGVSFNMVKVTGGTFQMGATFEQKSGVDSMKYLVHSVTLSDYYIGETEVTQELWQAVMGNNPSHFKGDKLPVDSVNWEDCQTFIQKLNEQTGMSFRLPTEAEWEFAARGGNLSKGYRYSGSNNIDHIAWYNNNSSYKTHEVGTRVPNEQGVYDMSGNVWEWCQDWLGEFSSSSQANPSGPSSGSERVLRGGCWYSDVWDCSVFYRDSSYPTYRNYSYGLRLAQ